MTEERPTTRKVLQRHTLPHIRELRLAESLFRARFAAGCSMSNCRGSCCRFGVYVDLTEKENILAHADKVRLQMDAGQEHNDQLWFEERIYDDPDFPSGRAVGTQAMSYGCVFLDREGKCVLQKTAIAEGMKVSSLKPFYCIAYPVTIDDGALTVDEPDFLNDPACCRPVVEGTQTVFDICQEEFEFVVGKEGLDELRKLIKR
jgi:Fe-S-cluster containining protein